MKCKIGDIIRGDLHTGNEYLKVACIEKTAQEEVYWGELMHTYSEALAETKPNKEHYLFEHQVRKIVRSADGTILPIWEKLKKYSRREQIIYIANAYKSEFLNLNYKLNKLFGMIAIEMDTTPAELYRYISFKLRVNRLSNAMNLWKYHVWEGMDEKEYKKRRIQKEKAMASEAIFSVVDVWKLLAYYCKYYSVAEAKKALARFERLFDKKDWERIKEMWTPLFYPDYDYALSKIIVCEIIKKRKDNPNVYDARLLDDDIKEGTWSKSQYLQRKCIIIAKDKNKERIDYLLKNGSKVKIIGRKDKPFRNKTSEILKITTIRKK